MTATQFQLIFRKVLCRHANQLPDKHNGLALDMWQAYRTMEACDFLAIVCDYIDTDKKYKLATVRDLKKIQGADHDNYKDETLPHYKKFDKEAVMAEGRKLAIEGRQRAIENEEKRKSGK